MIERMPAPTLPKSAPEREMLEAFLDFFREALLERAAGLDEAGLNASHPPTSLTLARLIGHMTAVEYGWFLDVFDGDPIPGLYDGIDWEADPDGEMTRAEALSADQLETEYRDAIADSRRRLASVETLDALSSKAHTDGERWSMRWILVHMIEEYARHCGHADLIREAVDGDVLS